jgi:ketosteroid isomerase-like protein
VPSPVELAHQLVTSFGDAEAIVANLAEDAEWWITPTVGVLGSPTIGREAIHASMKVIFGELYSAPSVEVHHCVGDAGIAAIRFTLRAVARFAGDQPYTNEYTVWIRRRGGLIDRVWEYLDVAWSTAQYPQP